MRMNKTEYGGSGGAFTVGGKEHIAELLSESVRRNKLSRIAHCYLKNDADVCDALQETAYRAVKSAGSLRNAGYFDTWLVRILINCCKDILKDNSRRAAVNEKVCVREEDAAAEDDGDGDVFFALRELDEKYRSVIVLFHIEGYDVKEIAAMLRVPVGTVKSRLCRGREKLKEIIEENR